MTMRHNPAYYVFVFDGFSKDGNNSIIYTCVFESFADLKNFIDTHFSGYVETKDVPNRESVYVNVCPDDIHSPAQFYFCKP